MADKLTPEKIEEIAKNFENIQDGKVPIIKSEKETVKLDYGSLDKLRPEDKPKADLSMVMYDSMAKYGGLGLSANQVGLPYRMFVMGGHPQIEDGKVRSVFNPLLNDVSEETVTFKEGCLSFPFLFLSITRPKWCSVKYTDQDGKEIEETLHGMSARIFQHENEHMNGYVFTDLVSKFKLERAEKARVKMIKEYTRGGAIR